ncbi:MAG: TetR family transcriptional regulator [Micromonosporaceae bacterium]|nr:TetR family transcriptional regulator [Micromonosporaceae bacterium]
MSTEPGTASYPSRSAELLWGPRGRAGRGPRPGLSRDQIVTAAIAVADRDGVDALSMRRVAAELRVGTMSLYRYVPGKAELLDLMLDQVSDPGPGRGPAAGADWRQVMADHARGSRDLYLAHPWLLQVNWCRPVFGPNTLAGVELVIAGLAGLGLTDRERVTVMIAIDSYVTGFVRNQILYSRAAEETGISDEEFWATQHPVLERAMASGDYPELAKLAEDSFNAGWEESFEFGLQRLLDGVQALVDARRRPGYRSGSTA